MVRRTEGNERALDGRIGCGSEHCVYSLDRTGAEWTSASAEGYDGIHPIEVLRPQLEELDVIQLRDEVVFSASSDRSTKSRGKSGQ